jgi:NADPH-dependent 2,4-dienoyl-CoA reductase/sulfur reductase-like enzyme
MTEKEIWEMIDAYARCAEAAREFGADGVDIHGAHGYLITGFTSAFYNRREDDWGGSLENRVRFLDELVSAVRKRVGQDFVAGLRFSGDEFVEGGLNTEESKKILAPLAASGRIDYLNISVGNYFTKQTIIAPNYVPLGAFVHVAAAIKEVVDIPVIAVGRIIDPLQAEQIIAGGLADLVAMNRAIIADPEFANKAREGRVEEIQKCIGCNEACWGRASLGLTDGISCTVNPDIGFEAVHEYRPAAQPKKILVIGGGVAGMKAATVAAGRGHRVTLYERSDELGGQVNIAAKAPGRIDMADSVRYLKAEVDRLNIEVHLSSEATDEKVLELSPDVVIVATGATGYIPEDITINDGRNVCEASQVLQREVVPGRRVLVVAGDRHMRAMTTIDFLLDKGCAVEAITEDMSFGEQIEYNTAVMVFERLYTKGVRLTPLTAVRSIDDNHVRLVNVLTGEEEEREVDTIVFAVGARANDGLLKDLRTKTKAQVVGIGDCVAPRRMVWAIREGAKVGREL